MQKKEAEEGDKGLKYWTVQVMLRSFDQISTERFFYYYSFFFFFVVNFVIHWNEKALGSHVFPIPIPPPLSIHMPLPLESPSHPHILAL